MKNNKRHTVFKIFTYIYTQNLYYMHRYIFRCKYTISMLITTTFYPFLSFEIIFRSTTSTRVICSRKFEFIYVFSINLAVCILKINNFHYFSLVLWYQLIVCFFFLCDFFSYSVAARLCADSIL